MPYGMVLITAFALFLDKVVLVIGIRDRHIMLIFSPIAIYAAMLKFFPIMLKNYDQFTSLCLILDFSSCRKLSLYLTFKTLKPSNGSCDYGFFTNDKTIHDL